MTFIQWLSQFEELDEPIGDLADDFRRCSDFHGLKEKTDIEFYLKRKGACVDAMRTFNEAWNLYKKEIIK
ncbi:YozE family protein [Corticicoccus populi]|uniref:YozE family protein n=1 Tax=Corticicoccus populi TaxID=1812821 RepID=A0ABW5WVQ0_9STAP